MWYLDVALLVMSFGIIFLIGGYYIFQLWKE